MKPALTIAQDETGKLAVLFIGDKRQMPTADAMFHNDQALRDAGFSGEVQVHVLRCPLPFRRRSVRLAPNMPILAADAPKGRQRKL